MLVIRSYDLGETIVPAYPGQPVPGCATFLGVTVAHEATSEDVLRVMGDILIVVWRSWRTRRLHCAAVGRYDPTPGGTMRSAMVVLASLVFVSAAHAAGREAVFNAPKNKVFAAALEVAATEFKLENADRESGLITFRSGTSMSSWEGQDFSLLIIELDAEHSKAIVNTKKHGRQAFDWGEGGSLQKKVLRLLDEKLAKEEAKPTGTPAPEAPEATPKATPPAATPAPEAPAPAPETPPTTVPETPPPAP